MQSQTKTAAEALLKSVKGIGRAHVDVNAAGWITRVYVVPDGVDDRGALRNAQSALMAVLGQNVDVNAMVVGDPLPDVTIALAPPGTETQPLSDPAVVELKSAVRKSELNEAARVAFDTLRAAQSNFHGFQFDGAELVRI